MSFPHINQNQPKFLIILISIYILILTRFTQQLKAYQSLATSKQLKIQMRVWQKPEDEAHNCQFSSQMWRLKLKNCQKIAIGDKIEVFSTVGVPIASSLLPKIPLTAQSFSVLPEERFSVITNLFCVLNFFNDRANDLSRSFLEKFPAPHGALIIGLLFGSAPLPKLFKNTLGRLGMQHITSVSGYNLTLVMNVFTRLIEPLGSKRLKFTVSLAILLFYLFICGFSFPLVRAAVMFLLSSLARAFFHRQYSGVYALFLTATLFLAWQPWLLFDLSFQLTMAATLGVMTFPSRMEQFFSRWKFLASRSQNPVVSFLKETFYESWVTTLAAQVFVWPILFAAFGQTSLLAFIANPLLLWLIPLATVMGLLYTLIFFTVPFFLPMVVGLLLLPVSVLVKGIQMWAVLPESFGQLFLSYRGPLWFYGG